MKLQADVIAELDNLLSTLNMAGIDKVIIEPGKIRAIDDRKVVGMITDKKVPDLGGKVLAISRVKALKTRFDLAKAQGDMKIEATAASSGSDIAMLEVAAGRSKSQFRCASSDAVKGKVPKTFNDVTAYELPLSVKQVPLIAQAVSAMAADVMTFASKDGSTVSVELVDSNKDVFTIDLEKPVTAINGKAGSFVFKYTASVLLSLLREATKSATNDEVKLTIGAQGIMFVEISGYSLFNLPQN